MITRRTFNATLAASAAGLAVSSSARSYAQIVGANDRVNFAVIGLNSRAYAHLSSLKANASTSRITHICDVDTTILDKFAGKTQTALGYTPAKEQDFRKVLASKDVDAITIATPDHWHAPLAIAGLQAGKHVYVEKPCSYNPTEGEMLVAAQVKYNKVVQMGSQQRSSPHSIDIIDQIHSGLIGTTTFARAFYMNNRKSIGTGTDTAPPPTLNWDIWQGPAPRRSYRSNLHPYNWHWFKTYGTGETLNNGTHEVDVCRWALGVGFPNSVTSTGGRYFFKDDWQFYDTLTTSFSYDNKMITWQGQCCSPMRDYGRDRGSLIIGTNGSVILDRDGYEVFDQAGKKIKDFSVKSQKTSAADLTGADSMTDLHFANFIAAIQHGEKLNAPVATGNVAVTMLQISNYAWETGRELHLDPTNGHIINDPKALALTHREYEKGWEPKV